MKTLTKDCIQEVKDLGFNKEGMEKYFDGKHIGHQNGENTFHIHNSNTMETVLTIQNESKWRRARFSIDGEYLMTKGIHNGDSWNGWKVPYFTKENIKNIIEESNFNEELYSIRIDDNDIFITDMMYEEDGEQEISRIEYEGEYYYHISGWIWDIEEDYLTTTI